MSKKQSQIGLLALLLLVFLLSPGLVNAESEAHQREDDNDFRFDRETQGDWIGHYGAEGYYLVGAAAGFPIKRLPENTDMRLTDLSGKTLSSWWCFWDEFLQSDDGGNGKAALFTDETKQYRRAACLYDGGGIAVKLSLGENTKRVSLYMTDFDGVPHTNDRTCEVILFDEDQKEIGSEIITDYKSGIYVSANVTGTVTFEIQHIGGPNAVLSAVFFDETLGPAVNEKGRDDKEDVSGKPIEEAGNKRLSRVFRLSDGILFSVLFLILLGLIVCWRAVNEDRKTG